MSKKVNQFLEEYQNTINDEYNIDEELNDYSRLPFSKVQGDRPKTDVRKKSFITCCVVSTASVAITLAATLPFLFSERFKDYNKLTEIEILRNTFDSYDCDAFYSFATISNKISIYRGMIDNTNYILYSSNTHDLKSYQYRFSFENFEETYTDKYNYFEIPNYPFSLNFQLFKNNVRIIDSSMVINS